MARKKDRDEAPEAAPEAVAEPVVEPVVEMTPVPKVVAPAPAKAEPAPKAEGQLTFDMYCSLKGIPTRHRPGMRAFTKVQRATHDEWAGIFESY